MCLGVWAWCCELIVSRSASATGFYCFLLASNGPPQTGSAVLYFCFSWMLMPFLIFPILVAVGSWFYPREKREYTAGVFSFSCPRGNIRYLVLILFTNMYCNVAFSLFVCNGLYIDFTVVFASYCFTIVTIVRTAVCNWIELIDRCWAAESYCGRVWSFRGSSSAVSVFLVRHNAAEEIVGIWVGGCLRVLEWLIFLCIFLLLFLFSVSVHYGYYYCLVREL